MWDIPKDKNFPKGAAQCDECGGFGCDNCEQRGWYPNADHPLARHCENEECSNIIPPDCVAVYCCDDCALDDA
jgi:hypothetical protein